MNKSLAIGVAVLIVAGMLIFFYEPKTPVTSAAQGKPLELDIQAQAVQDLAGMQADVVYDPTIVQYQSVSEGPFLDAGEKNDAMLLSTVDASQQGSLKGIVIVRLQPSGVSGTGVLATVHFRRLKEGNANIQLQNVLLSNSAVQPLPPSSVTGLVIG